MTQGRRVEFQGIVAPAVKLAAAHPEIERLRALALAFGSFALRPQESKWRMPRVKRRQFEVDLFASQFFEHGEIASRRGISDVLLRGHVCDPRRAKHGGQSDLKGVEDTPGVRLFRVTFDHARNSTGVVNPVQDIPVLNPGGVNGFICTSTSQRFELANVSLFVRYEHIECSLVHDQTSME